MSFLRWCSPTIRLRGAALSRRRHGETVAHINRVFPHWFCSQFHAYGDAEDEIPVDQHQLIALMAPRPVYVASALEDDWADPKGEFLSAYRASEVYSLYDKAGCPGPAQPELNQSVGEGVGYHLRSGRHDLTTFDDAFWILPSSRTIQEKVMGGFFLAFLPAFERFIGFLLGFAGSSLNFVG